MLELLVYLAVGIVVGKNWPKIQKGLKTVGKKSAAVAKSLPAKIKPKAKPKAAKKKAK